MNELNLICFMFLARTKNLATTAKTLALSENTILRNIYKMEEELQVGLFSRDIGRIALTTAGQYYYDINRSFEAKLSNALLNMNNPKTKEVLHLAWDFWLGCPQWLNSAIRRYVSEHQELEVRLICDTTNDMPGLFQRREVDVVFGSMEQSRRLCSPHHTVRMEETPLFLAVSANHLLAGESKVSPVFAPFVNMTVPLDDETEDEAEKRVNEFHAALGYLPKYIAVYDNWNSVYLDAAFGNGTCVTPKNDALENNDKIKLIPTGHTVTFTVSWMNTTASRYVRPFIDYIVAERENTDE